MKKKLLILLVLLGLILTACGDKGGSEKPANNASSGDSVTMQIGHVEPEDRSTHISALEFKKNVEERSNGTIVVELYPNGSLGGDVQLTESVAMGTLQAAFPATSVLTAYADDFGILDMPFLFTGSQAAFDAMDGEVGEYFSNKLLENGITNLGYSYNGPRSTTNNIRPIEKPEDLKGIKMRVMESPVFIDFYNTLGANATPMSFNELYTGLQQGTVDGQENPPTLIYANKFYEVQKYLSVDEHVHNFLAFVVNKNFYDSLSPEQQEIVSDEAKKYCDNQRALELEENGKIIEKLAESGLVVNVLNEDQKIEFKKALEPMYDNYRSKFGEELFELCEKYN